MKMFNIFILQLLTVVSQIPLTQAQTQLSPTTVVGARTPILTRNVTQLNSNAYQSASTTPLLTRTYGSTMNASPVATSKWQPQGTGAIPGSAYTGYNGRNTPLKSPAKTLTPATSTATSQQEQRNPQLPYPSANPTAIQELASIKEKYTGIKLKLDRQALLTAEAHTKISEQIKNWYFPALETQTAIEEAMSTVSALIDVSRKYTVGIENLFTYLNNISPNIEQKWIDQLREVVELADSYLMRAADTLATVIRLNIEIDGDQRAYKENRVLQKSETEAAMEKEFSRLLDETSKVGKQANKILTQAVKEWTSLLKTYCKPDMVQSALERLKEATSPTLADMQNLGPEDIDTAMSDAHHCIEDVKSLFYSCAVPPPVIRQSVPPVQLAMFSCVNKAKSISYDTSHHTVKRSLPV